MLCVTMLFHYLVCVCVLPLISVHVVMLSYHHSILVLFTNQRPSHSFHLSQSISYISSVIAHLIHHSLFQPITFILAIICHTHVTLSCSLTFTIYQEIRFFLNISIHELSLQRERERDGETDTHTWTHSCMTAHTKAAFCYT